MTAVGSREYWQDAASYPEDWASRSERAARFVRPGQSVLEIGCGPRMSLRNYLPTGCIYLPADLFKWNHEVQHVDVDAGIFPYGEFDCVVLLGVIEYLHKPELVFSFAKEHASSMIISYCYPTIGGGIIERRKLGWVSSFSREALAHLVTQGNWRIERSDTFLASELTHQMIHLLAPRDGQPAV
jgi:hypothetical protein